jgi:CRP-like cAMP-binding protein
VRQEYSTLERLFLRLELRDRLHPEERTALTAAMSPQKRPAAGQEIVREGSSPYESMLLIDGLTGRVVTLQDGSQQITALHVGGDFVDLHSFLLRRMDHSVVALTDCTIATVSHPKLRDLTSRYPHLTRLLWLSTLLDAAIHRQWLAAMGRREAVAQLAHLLCELYLRLNVVGLAADHAFDLPLNQAVLANALGRSRATVNGAAQQVRADGLVSWSGAQVEILDWAGLAALAQFDPTYLQLETMPV